MSPTNENQRPLLRGAFALLVGLSLGVVVRASFFHEGSAKAPDATPPAPREGPAQVPSPSPEKMGHSERGHSAPIAKERSPEPQASELSPELPSLNNPVCPIMGNAIEDPESGWVLYEGHRVNFCCPPCFFDFAEDAQAKLDELARDHSVEIPPVLRERIQAFPTLIEVENEKSPIGGSAIDEDEALRVVHHGVSFFLAEPSEIEAFLAAPDQALEALCADGHAIDEARRR